jgi:hypothetical protein
MSQLDKFTFGNYKAAIYLADTLNKTDKKNRIVIKHINNHQKRFRELEMAWASGIISATTLFHNAHATRKQLKEQCDKLVEKGVDELVIQLYSNIITTMCRVTLKGLECYRKIEMSTIAKANNMRKKGLVGDNDFVEIDYDVKGKHIGTGGVQFKNGSPQFMMNLLNLTNTKVN